MASSSSSSQCVSIEISADLIIPFSYALLCYGVVSNSGGYDWMTRWK